MEYLVHFGFTSERLSPLELRDLVHWTVKPQILAVPGVAQAQIFGGECASGRSWSIRSSSPRRAHARRCARRPRSARPR